MDTLEKFEKIIDWFAQQMTDPALELEVNQLAPQQNLVGVNLVEELLGESFHPNCSNYIKNMMESKALDLELFWPTHWSA